MTDSTQPVPRALRVTILLGWLWLAGFAVFILASGLTSTGPLRTESLVAGGALALIVVAIVRENWRVVTRGTPSRRIRPPYEWHLLADVTVLLMLAILAVSWLLRRGGFPREAVSRGELGAAALVVGTALVVGWRIRRHQSQGPKGGRDAAAT